MESFLLLEMIERMSVAALLAFVLSQTPIWRSLIDRRLLWWQKVLLAVFFGLVGIAGTYAGIPTTGALANSRAIGVMAAGLMGGRAMGLAAGAIAGSHRYLIGGFTAFSCALSTICEGWLAGEVHRRFSGKPVPWWAALATGLVGEGIQMLIILVTANPYHLALELVQQIGVPMALVNSLGIAVMMLIINTVMAAQQRAGAEQSQKALDIATKTLPYLRRGLNGQSAQATAAIIYDACNYSAVAITNECYVLAYIGAQSDHHCGQHNALTRVTDMALSSGALYTAQTAAEIGCSHSGCKLASAVVVPLKRAGQVIGALKLYYLRTNAIGPSDITFATGLGHLFSTQLELTEIDRQAKLTAQAELKALHAQIHPHFLFNTLNTITSLIRTQPDLARELLLKLGLIFRFVLHKTGCNITLAEELEQVRAYLTIEKARYGQKLRVSEDIPPAVLQYLIPSLIIQPIVENAVKHGLQPKEAGGAIVIKVVEQPDCIEIYIIDDGVGMDLSNRHPLRSQTLECESIGLSNVHERLRAQFGGGFGLELDSTVGGGSCITIRLPKLLDQEGSASA